MRLETARLVGEPIAAAHTDALAAMLADPRVGATMGGVLDRAATEAQVAALAAHWERHGFGYWMWRDRSTGEVVARGGLSRAPFVGDEEVEVGWLVAPGRWGQGLATELGAASVRFAFEDLDRRELVAFTLPENAASRRVIEKLGFAYERDIVHAGLPHVLYRLERAP